MKVLSVRQPWAWAILSAGKDVENRSWGTAYRGPLAIQAARIYDEDAEPLIAGRGVEIPGFKTGPLARGALIGLVELVDVFDPASASAPAVIPPWVASPWYEGRVGWLLASPVTLPVPINVTGNLGLRDLAPDLEDALRAYAGDAIAAMERRAAR